MRNLIITIGLSILLTAGGFSGYAARTPRGERHERHEQRDNHRQSGNRNHNRHDNGNRRPDNGHKDNRNKHDHKGPGHGDYRHPGNSAPRPGSYGRPTPPPPPHHRPAMMPPGHRYPDRLGHMVSRAARGARNVSVWQVDNNTYVVRYFKKGRYYTRYLYPYANRYGAVQVLAPAWQPLSSWFTVPSVQVNLWL